MDTDCAGRSRAKWPWSVPRVNPETVAGLFAIPNCAGQREFAPDSIFANGAQFTATDLLSLGVMCPHPEVLQFGMMAWGEIVRLEDGIKFLEIVPME